VLKNALRSLSIVPLLATTLHGQTTEKVVFARATLTRSSTWGPAIEAKSYLRVIDADGSHEHDLKLMGVKPAISPEGTKIAYCSGQDSYGYQLWIAEFGGANAHRLLEVKDGSACEPSWSPDGKQLSMVLREKKTPPMIAIINADGSGLRRLVPGLHPSWSAQGDKLAFEEAEGRLLRIATINVDGTNKKVLVAGDSNNFEPAWSPDGRRIAFVSDRNDVCAIYTSSADGQGSLHRMVYTEKGQLANPAWFPDGERIAYEWSGRAGMMNSKSRCSGITYPHVIAITNLSGGSRILTDRTNGMHPAVARVAAPN
jgi:Tol biopolymer transport system component